MTKYQTKRSWQCFWLVVPWGNSLSTNQKHFQELGSARHLYGISALVTRTSFCEGSSGDLAKRRLRLGLRMIFVCLFLCMVVILWKTSMVGYIIWNSPRKYITVSSHGPLFWLNLFVALWEFCREQAEVFVCWSETFGGVTNKFHEESGERK